MNTFLTTPEHEAFRMKIREFAEKEVRPIANQLDKEMRFPTEIFEKLSEMGVMGTPWPTEYGGLNKDYLHFAIMVEELSRVDAGVGVTMAVHILSQSPIINYGTDDQKAKYLPDMASGRKIGAFCLTEQNSGSDASKMETTATLDGDDYIINGQKIFITNAPHAQVYIVVALTDPEKGPKGASAFIVDKGLEGFTISEPYDKMGIRSSHTCELNFNNVRVPKENLLGREGEGFRVFMASLDGGRIGIGAQSLGIAQGAYEASVSYSKERVQFGQPIAFNQAISFKLADMATKIRCARLLVYSAAMLREAGEPYGMEASMAKMYASDIANEICTEAVQIHGGAGFMKGMHVERAYRDAKITTIYEGTNEIQRMVIGGFIVGKPPKKDKGASVVKDTPQSQTGTRKLQIFNEGSMQDKVDALVAALKSDGYDFTVGQDTWMPVNEADRLVSVGKGIGEKKNLEAIEALAYQVGGAIACSRPVAESLEYMPINRYIGMSGQKFMNNLYIAIGISGAGQHLKGIKSASTIVAINNNANAPIFKNCDYGIVGTWEEIVPLLTKALDNGELKKEMDTPKKIKRATAKKLAPNYKMHICNGCGYVYDQELGDLEGGIMPGTPFDMLPYEWSCPECGEEKTGFIAV